MLLYPFPLPDDAGYPDSVDFEVVATDDGKGRGLYARRAFSRGAMIARVTGIVVPHVMQHTLQISPVSHLHDPHFSGMLLHSCDPNTHLDMQHFELWAARDIAVGEALTMDYATTEDVLFRQFACGCGSSNCRRWITGRREAPDLARMAEHGLVARQEAAE